MYSTELYDKDTMARAKMVSAVVSPKDSREVSAALRGKSVSFGLALLADVKAKKRPIRFTRFNQESAGHRRGTGPGRYPFKAAEAFETLLSSARANAEFKDLDPEILRIVHIKADIAPQPFRFGRHRGRTGKRAHLEVVVVEDEKLKEKAKKKQSVAATKQKAESKKATKKPETADSKSEAKSESKATKTDAKDAAAAGATTQTTETKKESKPEAKAESKPAKAESSKEPEADAPQTSPKKDAESKANTTEQPKTDPKATPEREQNAEDPEKKADAPQQEQAEPSADASEKKGDKQ